jgi:signal transduction histidine kinase/CheY-like chemotaxis protein
MTAPRALRVRGLTIVVFVGFLVLSSVVFVGIGKLVDRQEHRLLKERTAEVSLIVSGALQSSFRDIFNTLSISAEQSPESFRLAAQRMVTSAGVTSVALVTEDSQREWVVRSAAGSGLSTGEAVTGDRLALIAQAGPVFRSDMIVNDGRSSLATVMGISHAAGSPGGAAGGAAGDAATGKAAIYLEVAVDPHRDTTVTQADAFHEIRAALYTGDQPDPSKLLLTTTDQLPITGDTVRQTVTFGADSWLLVTAARQPLAGPLLRGLPWLLAAALLVVGVAMAGTVETVGRGRDRALRLVAARTKALEDSLHELRVAQQAKSEFLSNMSHELRTPLNAIIGFSDLMTREPATSSEPDRIAVPSEWIEHINASGLHLLDLINDILDLAKVEAGRIDLAPEPIALRPVISAAVATLRPLMVRKELSVVEDIDDVAVIADRVRLRQIIDNLLSNAIKFTPDGGRIGLTARGNADQVLLDVDDTGVGIAPDDQERVFDEFQQVGDRGSRTSGTGLGLALTRRLVLAHGGTITLQSTVGVGSKFTVALPAAELPTAEVPAATPAELPAAEATAVGTVLVIEDDAAAVRLLRAYLEHAGYAVRVAVDGPTGLAEAIADPPDAIVLDVILPGIDGWEVLRRIKLEPRSASVPTVMVTVVDEHEIGLALGAVDYLVKPIDPEVLVGVLRKHIDLGAVSTPTRAIAIDDDEPSLRVVTACLEQQGVEVLSASGGRAGLALVRDRGADVILCDLLMPDMDGYEVVAQLQRDPATRRIPILVVTAQDLSAEDKARLNGNILGIVQKGASLERGISRWLAQVTHRSSGPLEGA